MEDKKADQKTQLDGGTYEIIQSRLLKQKNELISKLTLLNTARKDVFGNIETELIANNRISTDNSCIARDIVTIGDLCFFGYNVHLGLRSDIKLDDVFSVYTYKDNQFTIQPLTSLEDSVFISDFTNLYKYYKKTIFSKFAIIGNYLHMVFQLSESITDIKTFKWLINDDKLTYVDNRSDHEFKFPNQHEFNWVEPSRDQHVYGLHPHVSILNKVFVETIGGDLTIKIEDNTDDGKGIYNEAVLQKDQTLDDGQYRYADLGNLIALEIKPFQEEERYFVYNHKIKEVKKIDSIANACVLLPDDQGIIFADGYYLQSGDFKLFNNDISKVKFKKKVSSPNGEDYLYVFYESKKGLYVLLSYNIIEQQVKTPIICNGFTILNNGELCYFKTEEEQTKHHVIQIWQTPFIKGDIIPSNNTDSLLYKIGNKDIVKAMAECQALITLLNKEDSYNDLYSDIAKATNTILNNYYWINEPDTFHVNVPLKALNEAANAAVDEFDKVLNLRKTALKTTKETKIKADAIFGTIKSSSFKSVEEFVDILAKLRTLRGEVISLNDIRYIDASFITKLEESIIEKSDTISKRCVQFLLNDNALDSYHNRVAEKQIALENTTKVIAVKKLEDEVNKIAGDLEMLIDIVSNLEIEDASHATEIIDNISLIFATINQLKAGLKNKLKNLGEKEAQAEFAAQIKLVDQSIINYLDIAKTPEKTDELLNKVSINLEDLEARFADFEDFITLITEKREEVYNAFESRKNSLVEAKNKKTIALANAAKRILKGVVKKSQNFKTTIEINGYFASDLMINKLHDIINNLKTLQDPGKAETIETGLKVAKEDAIRKLKDTQDLYEDGENIIKLGKHKFGVNKQVLDLTIVYKDNTLKYHLTGTDFYQTIKNDILINSKNYWNQELISENDTIYRSAYLAYKLFKNPSLNIDYTNHEATLNLVKKESSKNYSEGYVKGVHDEDAALILTTLLQKHNDLGLLRYTATIRAYGQIFWKTLNENDKNIWNKKIKSSGEVLKIFPNSKEYNKVIKSLSDALSKSPYLKLLNNDLCRDNQNFTLKTATYLFEELQYNDNFCISKTAKNIHDQFIKTLENKKALNTFKTALRENLGDNAISIESITLALQWVSAFIKSEAPEAIVYSYEVVALIIFKVDNNSKTINVDANAIIKNLKGSHGTFNDQLNFNYHDFIDILSQYTDIDVPAFKQYRKAKNNVTHQLKTELKLEQFKPRVLSSFVRNKLIDKVYLPLFGDNLSKQLGSVGKNKRTDRMGMLLLISPPGYGKTTLMEYLANRLGLVFMKINGPSIGHEVTSVDPLTANNSAAREELKKLNLAFEMGNNVMLYLDDIQHCNPEFLQKFISLADGTRKIEGVYNGEAKTYDLRDKKFCIIMAGNPYTESGDKFQIPDMLANRADIYNLGDIIGDTADLFKLSLIENALTSNPILHQLSSKHFEDVYKLIEAIESSNQDSLNLKGNHTKQEIQEYLSVLDKVITIRDTVLTVNETYIKSAAMDDTYRIEPSFKLQGSYRDMNKLIAKVVPVMNEKELQTLLLSHYENESQTLTSAAEANLLKYKELTNTINNVEVERWKSIKTLFLKNNKLKGFAGQNGMQQVLAQMVQFSEHLEGIQTVLKQGLKD